MGFLVDEYGSTLLDEGNNGLADEIVEGAGLIPIPDAGLVSIGAGANLPGIGTDIAHQFGNDLSLSASGDLLTTETPAQETQQRVLRRLLTPLGGYVWHMGYGAGLPQRVGQPANAARIRAVIARQMRLEKGVGRNPAPSTTVTATDSGLVTATVRYADLSGNSHQVVVTP